MQTSVKAQHIAVIGIGSRGLSVLEQLIGWSRRHPRTPLRIDLFDPQPPGSGLHLTEQPDYLMLNTMAGQICAYSTAHPAWQAHEAPGLTFLQWCTVNQIRLSERGHVCDGGEGRPVDFADFVPRKLLGRYLRDCYRYLLRLGAPRLQIRHYRDSAVGCRLTSGNQGFKLRTQAGQTLTADAVFMTTGHAPQPPLHTEGRRVAIEGLGLCAMDSIAALTEGRGGGYVRQATGWRYQSSGREPQIYLYSRSGLPFHCRPQGLPLKRTMPRVFFTAQAIAALRAASPEQRLDFRQQVLPLIEDEMRAVFYLAHLEPPERREEVRQRLLTGTAPRRQVFQELAAEFGGFEPQDYLSASRWQGEPAHYAQWFRHWIAADLARSALGVEASALTQALEVWRNSRDLLRLVADHNGLTRASTHDFYATWAALSNRLVGGPQRERYEDLLALIDAGVVTPVAPGTAHTHAFDEVISARNAHSGLSNNRSPLIDDLLEQGLIIAAHACPADGIAVDSHSRALNADGLTRHRLWVLGPSVEGSSFYNHYVPTPDPACKAALDAHAAVDCCMNALSTAMDLALH